MEISKPTPRVRRNGEWWTNMPSSWCTYNTLFSFINKTIMEHRKFVYNFINFEPLPHNSISYCIYYYAKMPFLCIWFCEPRNILLFIKTKLTRELKLNSGLPNQLHNPPLEAELMLAYVCKSNHILISLMVPSTKSEKCFCAIYKCAVSRWLRPLSFSL